MAGERKGKRLNGEGKMILEGGSRMLQRTINTHGNRTKQDNAHASPLRQKGKARDLSVKQKSPLYTPINPPTFDCPLNEWTCFPRENQPESIAQ